MMKSLTGPLAVTLALAVAPPALATSHGATTEMQGMPPGMLSSGIVIPSMDSSRGRELFAEKGCVTCHSINGVGGTDARKLDAEFMDLPMNPFDFAARMWRGAPTMVELQREELGAQIQFTGEELANIIAFVHDAEEQAKFSEADIPEEIREKMEHHDEKMEHHDEEEEEPHG